MKQLYNLFLIILMVSPSSTLIPHQQDPQSEESPYTYDEPLQRTPYKVVQPNSPTDPEFNPEPKTSSEQKEKQISQSKPLDTIDYILLGSAGLCVLIFFRSIYVIYSQH